MTHLRAFALLILLVSSFFGNATLGEEIDVDVEIVIAVDASGSIGREELQLQLDGVAAAVRDPVIQQAVAQGPNQRVMVSMLIWSDAGYAKHTTDWHILSTPASFEAFASEVETFRETVGNFSFLGGGGTNIGDALAYAVKMLDENNARSPRRIVDISGDGPESIPWIEGAILLPQARKLAEAQRIIVNGLAIETDVANLSNWYRRHMITGPGSFVIVAENFEDFKQAIRRKLFRELSPVFIGQLEIPKSVRNN